MFIQPLHSMIRYSLKHVSLVEHKVLSYYFWPVNDAVMSVCAKTMLYGLFRSIKPRNFWPQLQTTEANVNPIQYPRSLFNSTGFTSSKPAPGKCQGSQKTCNYGTWVNGESQPPYCPANQRYNDRSLREFHLFQWLRKAPLQPLNPDLSKCPSEQNTPTDDHHGMASIPFPSLINHVPENGLWCYGCEWIFEQYRFGKLPSNVQSQLVPAGVHPFSVLHGSQNRALSRTEFLHHVQHCYGARELVAKFEKSTVSKNRWDACTARVTTINLQRQRHFVNILYIPRKSLHHTQPLLLCGIRTPASPRSLPSSPPSWNIWIPCHSPWLDEPSWL